MNEDKVLPQYNFSKQTKVAAVIGDPISQSLSPHLHNYWLKQNKIDAVYMPIRISIDEFPDFIKSLSMYDFVGYNITIPHKETVLEFCDSISEAARQIGAVNTVVMKDRKIHGDNSDHFGFIQNIKSEHPDFDFKNQKALLLGAGGAARAIVFGLLNEGVEEITIVNRNLQRAEKIAEDFTAFCHSQKGSNQIIKAISWEEFFSTQNFNLSKFDLLINSTSLGMVGKEELQIDLSSLKKTALVADIVYNPLITNLLQTAEQQGNPISTGIGMLIYQGLVGFEQWFGITPQVDQELIDEMIEFLQTPKDH